MGLGDFLRRRARPAGEAQATGAPIEEAAEPPLAVVVVRQGMNVAPTEYVDAILEAARPGLAACALARRALSQPVWFPNPDAARSAAVTIALAYRDELAVDPSATEHEIVTGPDGAKVMLLLLYGEAGRGAE